MQEVVVHTPSYRPNQWPRLEDGRDVEILLPLSIFDKDLGMQTKQQMLRQLAVDLPRSRVFLHGQRTLDPRQVLREAMCPRLCTQAVMAPFVEWAVYSGYLLVELPTKPPLCVIIGPKSIHSQKTIGRVSEGGPIVPIELQVFADGNAGWVILRVTEV